MWVGLGSLQKPLQVSPSQDMIRQREQRGRHLHLRHCSSRRDTRYCSKASSSSTGSRLSMTTSWLTSSPGLVTIPTPCSKAEHGAACAPALSAWTPHRAKRKSTASEMRDRAESVEGMLSGGEDLHAALLLSYLHCRPPTSCNRERRMCAVVANSRSSCAGGAELLPRLHGANGAVKTKAASPGV